MTRATDWTLLGRSLGLPAEELVSSLGRPDARRASGSTLWLGFRTSGATLRVRCAAAEGSGSPRVTSWSVSYQEGPATLREAAEPLGLWPICAPDEVAELTSDPVIRRPVPGGARGSFFSLTATVRGAQIRRLALFDEEPDWM